MTYILQMWLIVGIHKYAILQGNVPPNQNTLQDNKVAVFDSTHDVTALWMCVLNCSSGLGLGAGLIHLHPSPSSSQKP